MKNSSLLVCGLTFALIVVAMGGVSTATAAGPWYVAPSGLSVKDWAAIQTQLTTLEKKLLADDGVASDKFGIDVAVSGGTIVVGAASDDAFKGAAYIFERNQGGANNWGQVKKLIANDGTVNDFLGLYVAISGDTVVVSASGANVGKNVDQGAAYIFERNQGGANNWGQSKKLMASDGAADDSFGRVAIYGDTIVVGATSVNVSNKTDQGAAYVFERHWGGANNWGEVKKLMASDGIANDYFGIVAIHFDTVVVGAIGPINATSNRDAVYIFARNQSGTNNWGEVKKVLFDSTFISYFGRAVSLIDDTLVVGTASNKAFVFERNQGGAENWGQSKELIPSGPNAYFGATVSLNGDMIVAGAANSNIAYVFARNQGGANNWGEVTTLMASDGVSGDLFGFTVSAGSSAIVVGAPNKDSYKGAAYVYPFVPSLSLAKAVDNPTPQPGQLIQYSIVISNTGLGAATNAVLSDTLPAGLTLAGPVTLNPPGLGTPGTLPNLVTGLTLDIGQSLTVSVPVMVNLGQAAGIVITNTATITSVEVLTPIVASVAITLADAPLVAHDDFGLTALDTPLTLYALSNDSDPNSDALTITGFGTPVSGTVSLVGITFVYTPTMSFLGTETFTYTVSTSGENANATVSVLVAPEVFRLYLPIIQR